MSFIKVGAVLLLTVLLTAGITSTNARADSILEIIEGDPSVYPRAPNPTMYFSPEIKDKTGGAVDPSGKDLGIEMWARDPETGALIPAYDGIASSMYIVKHGQKGHWTLTPEGKKVSGIDQLQIRRVSEDTLSIRFRDAGILLPDLDYSLVCIIVRIGLDEGEACYSMSLQGSWWRAAD